jgi:hypothetical protein
MRLKIDHLIGSTGFVVKPIKTTEYSTTKETKENKSANSFWNLYLAEDKSLYALLYFIFKY